MVIGGIKLFEAKASIAKRRGLTTAPTTETELTNTQNIFVDPSDGGRIEVREKLFYGWNQRRLDKEDKEFLIELGYQNVDYELASRKQDRNARAAENRELRKIIPIAIDEAMKARKN